MFYEMEKVENCRDLGGITNKDGKKVKDGMLFRAGGLSDATDNDKKKLENLGIKAIIDFRSDEEVNEKPDLMVDGADYYHMQANYDKMEGVEKVKKEEGNFFDRMIIASRDNPYKFPEHMVESYKSLINNPYSNKIYNKFLNLLVDDKYDKVLWHCTAGKDRTGIAGILVLEILGVEKEKIYENYLLTNLYLKNSTSELVKTIHNKIPEKDLADEISKGFTIALSADERFFNAAYDEMEKLSGSVENYLKEYVGVTEELKKQIKDKYLED